MTGSAFSFFILRPFLLSFFLSTQQPTNQQTNKQLPPRTPTSIPRKRGTPLARRSGEPGLGEDLLHAVLAAVEDGVDLVEVLEADAVGDHLQGVEVTGLDHGQQVVPVLVHGGLAVADQADAAFHEGADVEVVGLFFR